jgi:hypothetical protein
MKKIGHLFRFSSSVFIKDSSYLAKVLLQTIWILGILKRDTKLAV